MQTKDELIAMAVQAARSYHIDPVLFCSLIEQESGWDTYAIRWEPGFFAKYVAPQNLLNQTEATARAMSWGLCQTMGQTAREFAFKGRFLSMLCEPVAGLDVGCRVLKGKMAPHPNSVEAGLLSYNGGASLNYAREVLARIPTYAHLANPSAV